MNDTLIVKLSESEFENSKRDKNRVDSNIYRRHRVGRRFSNRTTSFIVL